MQGGLDDLGCRAELQIRIQTGGVFDRRVSSRQARYGHAEGRAADVVVANQMAELDRFRIAAVLAANAHFQIGAGFAAVIHSHLHQFAHAVPIQRLEGILFLK